MSRVGNQPIALRDKTTVKVVDDVVQVKGPKGELSERIPSSITVVVEEKEVRVQRPYDSKESKALHGLSRALIANMVLGVHEPFVKQLEIQGVGYRADVSGKKLNLLLGFSHPVAMPVPDGLKVSVENNTLVKIEGINRQQVGQFAADVRALRPPEPYKGKGVRYLNEQVRRKVGKAGTA